jgi:hypothetical protein
MLVPLTQITLLQLLLSPILDGEAVLYSFESTPEVRIGVAFGSGGSQAGPGMELPGVSTWLVGLCGPLSPVLDFFTDSLHNGGSHFVLTFGS